jgi:serine/threonine protein kinase
MLWSLTLSKPDNVLLDNEKNVRLIDYGVAKRFTDDNTIVTGTNGTIPFVSPEACSGVEYDAFKADIWSLGIFAVTMVTGKLPFWSENLAEVFDLISSQE